MTEINVENTDFHPVLKDIENIFWFFILSNKALSLPNTQDILKKDVNFLSMLEKYNKWVCLSIEIKNDGTHTSKMNIKDQMVFIGKAMTILTYDYLLFSKYNAQINNLGEFKFLKFIRNGAAHYNKFNLKDETGNWKLKKDEIVKWKDKEISIKLHDAVVFNEFIGMFEIFLLSKYFSDKLTEIDGSKK